MPFQILSTFVAEPFTYVLQLLIRSRMEIKSTATPVGSNKMNESVYQFHRFIPFVTL